MGTEKNNIWGGSPRGVYFANIFTTCKTNSIIAQFWHKFYPCWFNSIRNIFINNRHTRTIQKYCVQKSKKITINNINVCKTMFNKCSKMNTR